MNTVVDFETGDTRQARAVEAAFPSSNLIVSNAQLRSGSYSLNAICDASDPPVLGHNHRSEVRIGPPVLGDRWYGASVFIPSDWSNDDTASDGGTGNRNHVVLQWHHENTESPTHPVQQPLELRILASKIEWIHQYGAIGIDLVGTDILWSDDVDNYKGAWTDWVIHANWTTDASTRLIEIWKNGVKVVTWTGTTSHPNGGGVYFKAGLTYDLDETRDVYVDELRMVGPSGNYDAVVPR